MNLGPKKRMATGISRLVQQNTLAAIIEASADGLIAVDQQGRMGLFNSRIEQMFGYRTEELLDQSIHLLLPPRHRVAHTSFVAEFLRQPERRSMAQRRDLYAQRKDGSEFPIEVGLNPLHQAGDVIAEGDLVVLATVSDVTIQKQRERELEQALQQKTLLFNELHHRVKNNLQVIRSLLSLQMREVGGAAAQALTDLDHRLQAMSVLHQMSSPAEALQNQNVNGYLEQLCKLLQQSIGGQTGIHLQFQGREQLDMPLSRLVPLGLLVNECVVNAAKHAFANQSAGTILVSLSADDDMVSLVVEDDGQGFDESASNEHLGMKIIRALASQLGGSFLIGNHRPPGHGARQQLFFPLAPGP